MAKVCFVPDEDDEDVKILEVQNAADAELILGGVTRKRTVDQGTGMYTLDPLRGRVNDRATRLMILSNPCATLIRGPVIVFGLDKSGTKMDVNGVALTYLLDLNDLNMMLSV